jgi:type I restriction enzyme S subunit
MTKSLSAGWSVKRLGDVAKVIPGFAFKSKEWCKEGIPVIKIKNIVGDLSVDTGDADCVPSDILTDKLRKYVLADGDILVAMTGATAGKVGRLRCKRPHLLNQRVAKLAPFDVDSLFFWAVVSSDEYQGRFFKLADGAAQPNMSGGQIEGVELLIPSPTTQRKIAGILSAYDDLIENNTRRIAILEQMAQSIYREWFVNFRFPGHQNVKLVDSPLGKIPEGWRATTLGEVVSNFDRLRKPLSSMQRADMKGEYPYYGAAKIFDYINNYIFDGKYLLVAEDGSVITPDRKPVLQMAYGKFWVNNHTHILQGKLPVCTEHLCLSLSFTDVSGYVTGAAQPKITQANMNRMPFLVATDDVQAAFTELVVPLFDEMHLLDRKNANLRQARDLLLPKLISGQLDVEDLDIDTGEPLVEAEA